MKSVNTKSEFPKNRHYAVVYFSSKSIYHEGDERSRTHPGHGYPAYTETINSVNYSYFETKSELEEWLTNRPADISKYTVLDVTPLEVKLQISATAKPATRSMET